MYWKITKEQLITNGWQYRFTFGYLCEVFTKGTEILFWDRDTQRVFFVYDHKSKLD